MPEPPLQDTSQTSENNLTIPGGIIIARRTAMLFAGLALLVWSARALPRFKATDAIFQAFALTLAGLACVGLFEFLRGTVGIGIFLAIIVELFFVIASFGSARINPAPEPRNWTSR